jgi:hypothetical protein
MEQHCPICGVPVPHELRYPARLCEACAGRARDDQGRPLRFWNTTPLGGGFAAEVEVDGVWQHSDSTSCWVDGRRCTAGEHRFGGIVVEMVDS